MRTIDVNTQTAIYDRSAIAPVNFVLVTARVFGGGSFAGFGFTDWGEDVTTNIVSGVNGSTVSTAFFGDEGPIIKIDPIPLKIGLQIDTINVTLNHLHPAVETMARGYDLRNVPVQIHRGYRDNTTSYLVAAPRPRFVGFVNGAPIETGPIGGQGSLRLKVVSSARELTRVGTYKFSDASQQQRSGDRFFRYTDNTEDLPVFWGEASS